jgi:hypothetical protein
VITDTASGKSSPARLVFVVIDGMVSGWNTAVDLKHAIFIRDAIAVGPNESCMLRSDRPDVLTRRA